MATGDTVYAPDSHLGFPPPGFVVLFGFFLFNLSTTTFPTLPSLAFVVAVRSFSILLDTGGRFNLISLVPFCLARIQ
ncbi:uncharacterized protein N7518_006823 [Penicillium psychrosexuale]|uniref:uncharacterized protein n=1 Tax=Penicillium psychrosexuale TaxID=1002107 RepID=UPI002545B230|nr:uncharacterized protein N7518_006823 [Penicillium psychrosexuale]KAJ5789812.1 hypothetical protein N7518_006823 [Penicillium psychrosexuale]